ncbi:DGQHR domain-containing protein [Paenibacillus sp. UNCCL117]|uniref:DNA sulfur modification protein DndB n=1 Tax=unclassified Paenibacillus TaxID=185978 RepID=UPI00088D15B1|nr:MULTISPECIES: DNA sulfur modification protein DndB [unclassified Paenibacillus]SDD26509.1 DGQHR domain-containing protein [Paenibacillus sp. cl123]SFW41074.1 DGQHR domain-containing protein [Paenibacillus sp. UNCCL117]
MDQISSLSELLSVQKAASFIEIPGALSRTFGQATLSTTLPMSKLFAIYEVDLEVQRAIVPQNLSRMMDYIMLYLDHGQGIYFPGLILSARGAGEYDHGSGTYRLQAIEKLYVVDGQHRLAAFRRLMETLQSAMARAKDRREYDRMEEIGKKLSKLYQFPMSTMIYLDINARQERQLFSDINKLPRKIGGNLAVLREQRRFYHVLATRLVEEAPVMKQIPVDMYTERGKGPEYLFSYHLLIEILIGLTEGRLKSASRGNSYYFEEKDIESQMEIASHYFEGLLRFLPAPEKGELCWSENLQIALAMFFHGEATKSGSFNRYALDYALHILPHLDWNGIYAGDEKDRLPRRSRIMKAYQYVKGFYEEHHLFLIRESDMMDELQDELQEKEDVG